MPSGWRPGYARRLLMWTARSLTAIFELVGARRTGDGEPSKGTDRFCGVGLGGGQSRLCQFGTGSVA